MSEPSNGPAASEHWTTRWSRLSERYPIDPTTAADAESGPVTPDGRGEPEAGWDELYVHYDVRRGREMLSHAQQQLSRAADALARQQNVTAASRLVGESSDSIGLALCHLRRAIAQEAGARRRRLPSQPTPGADGANGAAPQSS